MPVIRSKSDPEPSPCDPSPIQVTIADPLGGLPPTGSGSGEIVLADVTRTATASAAIFTSLKIVAAVLAFLASTPDFLGEHLQHIPEWVGVFSAVGLLLRAYMKNSSIKV